MAVQLTCPLCNVEGATISAYLNDPGEFFCHECEEIIERERVQTIIDEAATWKALLDWTDKMPCGPDSP